MINRPVGLRLHELHYNLGHVLYEQGDWAGAAENYRQTIALSPDCISAYNNLGCTLTKAGQVEAAIEVYQQAIALQPNWAVLHSNLGQALFGRDPIAAIVAYRRATTLDPALTEAYYNWGKTLQAQEQHAAAIECFERVLQLDPEHLHALSDCGMAWMMQGYFDRTLKYFQQAIVAQRDYVDAFCDWALQLTGSDELTQTRKACGQFLRLLQSANFIQNSDWGTLLHHWAQVYWHLGNTLTAYGGEAQYQQAEQHYQRAIQLQPDRLEFYLGLMRCLSLQERWNAAILTGHQALAVHPNHSLLYRWLGSLFERQQQWEQAIDYYRKSLQAQPSSQLESAQMSRLIPFWEENRDRNQDVHADGAAVDARSIQGFYPSIQDWYTSTSGLSGQFIPLPSPSRAASVPSTGSDALSDPAPSACSGLNCSPCLKRILQGFKPTHLGNSVYGLGRSMPSIAAPPQFTAVLPQGQAWAVPRQNQWQICHAVAVLTPDDRLLADVSRFYPGELPGCQHLDPKRHPLFTLKTLPEPEVIDGRIAVLAGLSGHTYYHWMVDVLPRLEILRRSGIDLSSIDGFWINAPDQGFQRDTLAGLGLPFDRVLESDQHPYIRATELIVPSFPSHLGWLDSWALNFLRQHFLPLGTGYRDLPDRLYICRATAHHRRVLNEAALLEWLQPLGFVPVMLETMTFAEQVALFAQAKVILAPHGGGLTNTIFCNPGTTVIELISSHYMRHYYWVISQQLGLKHYFVTGEELACYPLRNLMYPSPLTEDIWVNLDRLQDLFSQLT